MALSPDELTLYCILNEWGKGKPENFNKEYCPNISDIFERLEDKGLIGKDKEGFYKTKYFLKYFPNL
ncbi:MAG: hypothetical protein V1914_03360 [archaeon]